MVKYVNPKIFVLAESVTLNDGVDRFLEELGASDWKKGRPDLDGRAQEITEVGGRSCYKSFGTELNPNITRVRDNARDYLQNTLSKGDGSIYEHSSVTFAFVDVSRVFTHELVRHRAGTAVSQESLRYMRPMELRMTVVPGADNEEFLMDEDTKRSLEATEFTYLAQCDAYIKNNMDFHYKKQWTSALRRMLPSGVATNVVWTANHRALRHVLTMRTHSAAEVEMRYVFDKVGKYLYGEYPYIYEDFETIPHDDGVGNWWKPKHIKA